ncbi:Heme-binding protein [Bacteroides fragilis]|jgi:uncharacterized protein GlcG (DUF336 family)|uniref:Heme-binding protein n=1 Tax=Chryseobacterium gallinarum TaxID=1324352 RepID=A0A0G3M7K8_CHRGL|nr:heme-binding protein [Chryseobacterium gallinarum]AKK74545.1 hypothetical protein OK18_19730 [Chryseobacterium gallinarum]
MNKLTKLILGVLFVLFIGDYHLSAQCVNKSLDLTQNGALKLAEQAKVEAKKMGKNVSVAVVNSSGATILLLKGDNVGVHNTEASRRKAYTSVSTKSASWDLMKKVLSDSSSGNLESMPELLLLGGGVPIWKDGILIGAIGVSGAGGGENDHKIAKEAVEYLGFTIQP